MNTGKIFRLALLLWCAVFLLSFGAGNGLAADKEEILIGSHLPLSGHLSSIGVEQKWAYETAVKQVNEDGGIYVEEYGKKLPVKLSVLDDESDPGKAASSVERLIKQKDVDLILSGHSAPFGVIPGCVAAEKYRKYYHATACFIPPWKEHNFNWSTLFFFRMTDAASAPFKLIDSIDESKRPQNIGMFMEDTFDGRSFGKVIKGEAEKAGYSVAYEEALSTESKDYTSQILKAKQRGIDAILIFASTSNITTFVRQAKANGLDYKYMHTWKGGWPAEFWDALGEDAKYILSDGHWSEDYPFPGASRLGKLYTEKFNKNSVAVGAFYALAQIMFQAIEDAGNLEPADVRQAVLNNKFDTVMGEIDYNEEGVGVYPAPAFQWIDGKQQTVYPFELAAQEVKVAPPWDERGK